MIHIGHLDIYLPCLNSAVKSNLTSDQKVTLLSMSGIAVKISILWKSLCSLKGRCGKTADLKLQLMKYMTESTFVLENLSMSPKNILI